MSNSTREHWLDRAPGEGVTDNNEIVNMVAFLVFVLGIMFACFGRKRCRNQQAKREEEAEAEAEAAEQDAAAAP
jgi:cbb3-type cytochrome oxidase subunit 3